MFQFASGFICCHGLFGAAEAFAVATMGIMMTMELSLISYVCSYCCCCCFSSKADWAERRLADPESDPSPELRHVPFKTDK